MCLISFHYFSPQVIYEEAKKKAMTATKREEVRATMKDKQKQKVSAEQGRAQLISNVKLAHIGVSGDYNYGSCTLKVSNIPKDMETGEGRLQQFFEDRLRGTLEKVLQVTVRARDDDRITTDDPDRPTAPSAPQQTTETDENGLRNDSPPPPPPQVSHKLSWGLLTVSSISAVTMLMHKCGPPAVMGDKPVIEVQQVDIHKAAASQGLFGAVFKEGQKKAQKELARLR